MKSLTNLCHYQLSYIKTNSHIDSQLKSSGRKLKSIFPALVLVLICVRLGTGEVIDDSRCVPKTCKEKVKSEI